MNTIDTLNTLSLVSNPLCKDDNYRNKVLDIIPQLEYLDDVKKTDTYVNEIQT